MNLQCARKNYKDCGGEAHKKGPLFHFCALLLRHPHRFRLLLLRLIDGFAIYLLIDYSPVPLSLPPSLRFRTSSE